MAGTLAFWLVGHNITRSWLGLACGTGSGNTVKSLSLQKFWGITLRFPQSALEVMYVNPMPFLQPTATLLFTSSLYLKILAELDNPPIAMLDLLREVIDTAEASSISSGYTEYALELEYKLHNARRDLLEQLQTVPKSQKAIEVFCLAVLVYLLRLTSTHAKDKSTKINDLVDEAFGHLAKLESLPFPLAILLLGLEARNDRERKVIVELIAGTEGEIPTQALVYVKSITASSWVQEDLRKDCSDGSIGYMENMNRLISSFRILPTFI